jgi:hypothetical protein
MIDESTMSSDDKLIDDIWNDILENYKIIQSLVEDSMSSSLYSQLLNRTNMSLSENEDDELSEPPVKLKNELIKEQQISLHKVECKIYECLIYSC